MITQSGIQKYINNFRRELTRHMRPDMGLRCDVHLADIGGAILVFEVGPDVENDDIYLEPVPTIGKALSAIKQTAFGGNLEGFMFGGTNVILQDNRIILIKDSSPSEWSSSASRKDVRKVLSRQSRQVQ